MVRIEYIEPVMVECGQCSDHAAHYCHRMGVAPKSAIDRVQLLVNHRVMDDVVGETVELRRRRQLAIEQEPADFEITAALYQHVDRIAAIEQNPFVWVDKGDRRTADPDFVQGGIVAVKSGVLIEAAKIDHRRPDRWAYDRQLGPVVAELDPGGPKICLCAHGVLRD